MTSSETLDKVVEELFELKDGTENIDPEAVCNELLDPEVGSAVLRTGHDEWYWSLNRGWTLNIE